MAAEAQEVAAAAEVAEDWRDTADGRQWADELADIDVFLAERRCLDALHAIRALPSKLTLPEQSLVCVPPPHRPPSGPPASPPRLPRLIPPWPSPASPCRFAPSPLLPQRPLLCLAASQLRSREVQLIGTHLLQQ